MTNKVNYLESEEYTAKVLDIFKNSEEYQLELFEKVISFYDQAATHVRCQFHQLIPNKRLMSRVFKGSFEERVSEHS